MLIKKLYLFLLREYVGGQIYFYDKFCIQKYTHELKPFIIQS